MPKSSLSDDELTQVINAILSTGGRPYIEELLEGCYEHQKWEGSAAYAYERYFHKRIVYRDYDVRVVGIWFDGDDVTAADIQFKRPARFSLLSRNRSLVKKLVKLMTHRYSTAGLKVKDDETGVREIHFKVGQHISHYASNVIDECGSECILYDETNSSGQTDPSRTDIRNDFVIIRFRRKG